MTRKIRMLLCVAGMAAVLGLRSGTSCAAADEAVLPFQPGETLTYSLHWKFIHAGTAVFKVLPATELNGRPACHFLLTVRTSPFLDLFYKVRDRVESFTDLDVTHSLLYKKEQREGKYEREVIVTYDWEKQTAQYEKDGVKRPPIFVYPGTFDPLAIIYFIRTQEFYPGKVLMGPVSSGRRIIIGRLRVVERQKVKVPAGKFKAFRIEPEVNQMGGVFKRSATTDLQVWMSADKRKIPLKVRGMARLGSFSALLASIEPGS